MKDQADRIGAGVDRGVDVGLLRDAADLDPRALVHGESTRAAPRTLRAASPSPRFDRECHGRHRSTGPRSRGRRARRSRRPASGRAAASTSASQSTGRDAAADRDQAADDVADHVMQERVGVEARSASRRRAARSRRSRIVFTGDSAWHSAERKALKSCSPTSACAGRAHRLAVERAKGPAGEAALERGPHRRLEQQVVVAPADRAGARVEARRHEAAPLDGDVGGQVAVGAAHPGVERRARPRCRSGRPGSARARRHRCGRRRST